VNCRVLRPYHDSGNLEQPLLAVLCYMEDGK
jgi:hypothetical protein